MSGPHPLRGQTALVTGATGFIGSALLRRLAAEGLALHAVARRAPCERGPEAWWEADLTDLSSVRELVGRLQPAVIFHLASHVSGARHLELVMPTLGSNLVSTVNLLTAATEIGCRRFVVVGSQEEPTEVDGVPCSPYAAAKHAARGYARMFHALYALPVVMVRVFMVYGPGQRDRSKLVPHVILSLLRGEPPALTSGTREVDWVYVDDVVEALLAAAGVPGIEGQTLDVGSGRLVSVRHVVEQLVQLVDPGVEPHFGAVPDRLLEQVRVADVARTTTVIGWKPSTGLGEGLRRTVEWYRHDAGRRQG